MKLFNFSFTNEENIIFLLLLLIMIIMIVSIVSKSTKNNNQEPNNNMWLPYEQFEPVDQSEQHVQLNQSDLDVWMHIVHLSRQQLPGYNVCFSAYAILTALGKGTGKSQHEWLKESMARLGGAFVEMTFHGRDSFGEKGFLRYYRDETTQRYVVELTDSMLRLFEDGYTHIEFEQRQKLRKQPLALWLHGFLSSHAAPYPLKISTIHRLSGSGAKTLRDFKYRMSKALEALITIGAIDSFVINEDTVKIKKNPTPSQQRYLDANKMP